VDRAVLAVSPRPDLLDRRGQPGRAVSDDQPWRRESASSEIAAELEPVFFGLSHPQAYGNQRSFAVFGDSPGADHAFLRTARADRQIDRIEEQHDQVDVVQRAATERLKPLVQLGADPGDRRARRLSEPGLFAQRLDVAHRETAHERADVNALSGSVLSKRLQCHFGNSFDTNGAAASRTCGISIRSSPSPICRWRGRNPLRLAGPTSGRRSYRARPNHVSNSSSTAR
jgi:hypothetical protein